MTDAKILVFDIETAPLLAYTWGTFNVNTIKVVRDWYMLTWAAKWYGKREVMAAALPDYKKAYAEDPEDDFHLVSSLWSLLDEADVVVAHNGNKFDIKKANARFKYHGMSPPKPFKSIDTCQIARQHFGFTSNRLDALGEHLGVGRKVDTGGFELWEGCMAGDKKAWNKMLKYNKQDVNLLERVYEELRPWTPRHPNLSQYTNSPNPTCSNCGSHKVYKDGLYRTNAGTYQAYECQECGTWMRSRQQVGTKNFDPTKTIAADRR